MIQALMATRNFALRDLEFRFVSDSSGENAFREGK